MKKITVTGVPEHFNFPWLQVVEKQPFLDEGIQLVWKNEPKGSGAMNKSLRDGETDIAIVLTESFIKDKIEGNPALMIGFHIESPLIWGIHGSARSEIDDISQLGHGDFVISRYGSGSHLMAFLLAKREGWNLDKIDFEVVGDLEGAQEALQDEIHKLFLWEKYTTKPLVDRGIFKRIGEIPTPWPCFVIVANPTVLKQHAAIIGKLLDLVYLQSIENLQKTEFPLLISEKYKIKLEDIKAWLQQTSWAKDERISKKVLEESMEILKDLGLIQKKIKAEDLIFKSLAVLY
ncbi:substrate-binding domain-containing protein [Aquiflexum gelatinilyticum]|uniref:Substrate-binding domain-containing protein n=1 Tax=Aquiflexum gelatinilyticum TaxID=2961943 RepID=A0A9X2SZ13_9BACT|nr:substrate-binding domain-containing protein [Aquiflexum gelatinilyticum]MCR9015874.1 substrate-binding domain-containing protein [Aquiflexum gelatinilyticum]